MDVSVGTPDASRLASPLLMSEHPVNVKDKQHSRAAAALMQWDGACILVLISQKNHRSPGFLEFGSVVG
ncbi:hypothetical protein [Arthrobacter sp. CJ23]|uniref:hypothetical protein n=1 Tax=Arthrobacter sp. CJ23 TaxID=2972479 RepID=UPI00215B9574|nr:hypothetical protein [Arthrobacter sp. CJ23]UVJ40310.1 hypothetical protein NVV90_03745 [Arthrobacter sp. CJ23]